jgi:hypothetical protein
VTFSPVISADDAAASKKLDRSSFEECLAWLPVDTESVRVGRTIVFDPPDNNKLPKVEEATWGKWFLRAYATPTQLASLQDGQYHKQLVGRQVALAVDATRYGEVVDKFGGQRYQGCCILEFQDDLAAVGAKLEEQWRKDCKSVRSIAGQPVYAFGPERYPLWVGKYNWEGTFICRPAPNLLLVATQEEFLETVLKRRGHKASDRALPDNLPFWKSVDRAAQAWMVRYIKRNTPNGLAWSLAASKSSPGFVVTFTPDDTFSKPISDGAAGRVLEFANGYKLVPTLKEGAAGAAILSIELPKKPPEEKGDAAGQIDDVQRYAIGFFLILLESDPVVFGRR